MSLQCFDFGNIVRDAETCSEFKSYLRDVECNADSLEFVQRVEEYQQHIIQEFKSGIFWSLLLQQEYTTMYCQYIQPGGAHELNLSFTQRFVVANSIRELNLLYEVRQVPSLEDLKIKLFHLFDGAIQFILSQLQMDSFSRFVRTSQWKKFCREHEQLYRKVVLPLQTVPLFTTAEFLDPQPHAREIQIAKYFILDSSQWKLESTLSYTHKQHKEKINFYKFEPGSIVVSQEKDLTSGNCYKFSYWYPFSYKKVIYAYFNRQFWKATGTDFKSVKVILPSNQDVLQQNHYAYARTFFTYTPAFQYTQEFLCNILFVIFRNEQGKKTLMMIMRTVVDESYPKEHPNNVRVVAFTVYSATKIDKESCRVVVSTYLSMKGWIQKCMTIVNPVLRRIMTRNVVKNASILEANESFSDTLGFQPILTYNKKKASC